jgi:hypothetical protein
MHFEYVAWHSAHFCFAVPQAASHVCQALRQLEEQRSAGGVRPPSGGFASLVFAPSVAAWSSADRERSSAESAAAGGSPASVAGTTGAIGGGGAWTFVGPGTTR